MVWCGGVGCNVFSRLGFICNETHAILNFPRYKLRSSKLNVTHKDDALLSGDDALLSKDDAPLSREDPLSRDDQPSPFRHLGTCGLAWGHI